MDEIYITIDYRPRNGEVLRITSKLSVYAYQDNKEVLEYAARGAAKQFSHDLDIELENLRYAPKVKSDQTIYDEIRDNYYKELDRYRT